MIGYGFWFRKVKESVALCEMRALTHVGETQNKLELKKSQKFCYLLSSA